MRLHAALILASLTALGCSNGSGGSNRGAAAAGSTAGTGSGATTGLPGGTTGGANPQQANAPLQPAFSMANVTGASVARQDAARDAFNDELQSLWDKVRPDAAIRLENELKDLAQQGKLGYVNGAINAGITNVRSVTLDAILGPGFNTLRHDKAVLAIPTAGNWKITADVDVGVSATIAGLTIPITLPVILEVSVEALLDVDIDDSDPTRPVIQRLNTPQTTISVVVRSNIAQAQVYLNYLNSLGSAIANIGVQYLINSMVRPMVTGFPGPVWADGAAPLADSGVATPFEEVAVNVCNKIRRDHMPHGCLHRIRMDVPNDDESWLDGYRNGGPGNQGTVQGYSGESDSAMNTAYFLATEAMRHRLTGAPDALDNLAWALRGIGTLVDINASGLLARSAAPATSVLGQRISARGAFTQTQLFNDTWVGWQSDNGVSRDQYTAVFFGLAIAYEVALDPQVRADCARRVKQLLDFLVAQDWFYLGDRPNWTQAGAKSGPLMWQGQAPYQQIVFLTIGEWMHPGRYTAELNRLAPMMPALWIGPLTSVNRLGGYYAFNLQMLNYYNYFRLETDQDRWMDMARAYRITQRWVGHHRNPHYDIIQCAIDPSLEPRLFPGIRESMRQFLTRNHREVAPPGTAQAIAAANIQFQQFTFGSRTSGAQTAQTVPTEPLPVPLRKYTGYYQWQKEPTRLAQRPPNAATSPGAYSEKPGTDFVLPYWWGRWHGAF